jgi:hypothetical protein
MDKMTLDQLWDAHTSEASADQRREIQRVITQRIISAEAAAVEPPAAAPPTVDPPAGDPPAAAPFMGILNQRVARYGGTPCSVYARAHAFMP